MEDISGLLHLARKAGRLAIGLTQVLDKANAGKKVLILITSDAGRVLLKRFTGIELKMIEMTSDRLGEIFKRDKISVVGVLDRNLAKEIVRRLDSSEEN